MYVTCTQKNLHYGVGWIFLVTLSPQTPAVNTSDVYKILWKCNLNTLDNRGSCSLRSVDMTRGADRQRNDTIKLPFALQKELGLDLAPKRGRGGHRGGYAGVADRKERRKADRAGERGGHGGRILTQKPALQEFSEDDEIYDEDFEDESPPPRVSNKETSKLITKVPTPAPLPKSILKKAKAQPILPIESDSELSSRASSPGLVLDPNSKSFQVRAEEDDAEISALEKRLGMKKGSKHNTEDDFDDILTGLGDDDKDDSKKRKREAEGWLESKRRRAEHEEADGQVSDQSDEDDVSDEYDDDLEAIEESSEDGIENDDVDVAWDGSDQEHDLLEASESDHEFAAFEHEDREDRDEDHTHARDPPTKKVRENPYVAPVTASSTGKYVPPAARRAALEASGDQDQALARLRRQIQGHLNKLAESNIISILNEIEKLYQTNARGDMTAVVIELILSLFCTPSTLSSSFIILHAAFVAGLYKILGIDFGAEVLSKIVEKFEQYHSDETAGKEGLNLLSLLAQLFTFSTVNSTIVFDHIRLLLQEMSETNTELVLRVINDCGQQLRHEDPSALKSIVQVMNTSRKELEAQGKRLSVRTQFMIERIEALKNGKVKDTLGNASVAKDLIPKMRKVLGSLNQRSLKATDPMRISLEDIRSTDKKGKWWLVGASWRGNDSKQPIPTSVTDRPKDMTDVPLVVDSWDADMQDGVDLLAVAREYGMNTDIRRSIFVAIMSATDAQDAYVRLNKLRLKRAQEQEIPRVVLRCTGGEDKYNPYYTLIAKKLCSDKRVQKVFQFALWDFFKKMGEGRDDDDSDDDDEAQGCDDREVVSVAKMYAHLILDGSMSLGVLRKLNFPFLKDQGRIFVEVLLISIMTTTRSRDEEKLVELFTRAGSSVASGLQWFIKTCLKKSSLIADKERAKIKRSCRVAESALDAIRRSSVAED